ncbi:unnamed protein product [Alternaria alternata]
MATSTRPDYGPDLLTDEENQQLDNFFSVRNTIDHPNERSAFNEETDVDHIQRWAGYAFQRATTPLTEQPPCEYIDGVSLDWSGHGTSHVDYNKSDVLPLTQGKFLGHGMHGGVYETSCNGVKLAWKRKYCRRKIGERERREIEVIKKLSHRHIIRLMGTYTHGPFLGLLLWPVATCDLASLLEDVDWLQKPILLEQGLPLKLSEEWTEQTEEREARLQALGILLGGVTTLARDSAVAFLKSTIGCIASAVAYIHESDIKHKDLKPSNILLSRNGLWLTDFGTATDFSVLTTSVTDNGERGTPKYFAPEVARFEPSGRAADIFSMGCIFFEIMILCIECSLDLSVTLRSRNDRSFQSNLDNVKVWLIEDDWSDPQDTPSIEEYLSGLVGSMMDVEVDKRPTASIVEWDVAIISGTEVMINITFGRTYLLPPYQNIWTFHIGYVDENLIQSVQMFALAAFSFWYEFYYEIYPHRFQYLWKIKQLHEEYGPIIRINPLQVHIHDADYFDTIYASGVNHKRDRCSWSHHTGSKVWAGAILETMDHDKHRMRRNAVSPFFSKRSVQALEGLVVNNIKKLLRRFEGEMEKQGPHAGIVILNDAYAAFAMDVISEYCFGESMKTLDNDDYGKDWLTIFHDGMQLVPFARQFPTIFNFLLDLPPHIAAKLDAGAGKLNGYLYQILGRIERIMNREDGVNETKDLRRTIFHDIRDDVGCKLPEKEKHPVRLMADASVILGAGTETTSRTMAVTTYYLIKNPEIGEKLRRELETVMPTVNHEVLLRQLEALPYLFEIYDTVESRDVLTTYDCFLGMTDLKSEGVKVKVVAEVEA